MTDDGMTCRRGGAHAERGPRCPEGLRTRRRTAGGHSGDGGGAGHGRGEGRRAGVRGGRVSPSRANPWGTVLCDRVRPAAGDRRACGTPLIEPTRYSGVNQECPDADATGQGGINPAPLGRRTAVRRAHLRSTETPPCAVDAESTARRRVRICRGPSSVHRPTRSHPPPARGTGPCPDTDAPGPERSGTRRPAGAAVDVAVRRGRGTACPPAGPFGAGFRRMRGAEGQGVFALCVA
jgi:hypothetical protein